MERVMQTGACRVRVGCLVLRILRYWWRWQDPIKEVVAMRVGSEPVPLNVQRHKPEWSALWCVGLPCGLAKRCRIGTEFSLKGTQGRVVIRLRETGHLGYRSRTR